jgi:2-methylisocitrate lyase-like PEP mutase family enzyme
MALFCERVKRPKLANMLEGGKTPVLSPAELEQLGYKIAAYPITLLNASIVAMRAALDQIQKGIPVSGLLGFPELRELVGFDSYDAEAERYR